MDGDTTILFVWRAIERIIGSIIAGILVYLGYRLFISLPDKTDSEGKVILPGNVSIYMSRIGPGAFFALFGAIIIGISIITQMKSEPGGKGVEPDSSKVRGFYYMGEAQKKLNDKDQEIYRSQLLENIERLNSLDDALGNYTEGKPFQMKPESVVRIQNTILLSKKELMLSVWQPEWGNALDFEQWVNNYTPHPPPKSIEKAAILFNKKGE